MKLIPLETWRRKYFAPGAAPSARLIRRWIATGRLAGKVGDNGLVLVDAAPFDSGPTARVILQRVLKKLGIRMRGAKQTRHTFATIALMNGVSPMWVAKQLGHKTMKITLEVYSRWIEGADQGRERAKLDAALGQSIGQSGQSQGTQG